MNRRRRLTCAWQSGPFLCLSLFCLVIVGVLSATAGTPTVNGLFYGDGDYLNYPSTPYATSTGGSKLYLTLSENRIYLALVVDRLVNDCVFSPKTNTALTASAGWTQHRALTRLLDSEFASFTLSLGSGANEQNWAWQQGTAGLTGFKAKDIPGENTYTNWISDETVAGGLGVPPSNIVSASSIQWNLNHYAERVAATNDPGWDMGSGGTAGWYSPITNPGTDPGNVVNVAEGYPPDTNSPNQITYSPTYEWEWPLVFEWSLDLNAYGETPVFVVTGISHHSPPKTLTENDPFLPEDYPTNALTDFGDLHAPYATTLAGNGARHVIDVAGAYLGSRLDSEVDGMTETLALGDDGDSSDDEDGVELLTPMIPGSNAVLRVTVGAPGALSAFIDFDGDYTLDAVTLVSSTGSTALTPGVIGDMAMTTGVYELTIAVPSSASNSMPARFRITNGAGEGGNSTTGKVDSGEVEDYVFLASVSDYVWDDLDGDGVQDAGEPGISNVTVRLLDASDVELATTTTDGSGWYAFTNLFGADYTVVFTPPAGYSLVLQDQGGDDTADSDAHPVSGRVPVILYPGQSDYTVDAGFSSVPTLAVLTSFSAESRGGDVYVVWETAAELGTIGFIVERRNAVTGDYAPIHDDLIPGALFSVGAKGYEMLDSDAVPGGAYTYRLIEIENTGVRRTYGPFTVTVDGATTDMLSWLEEWFGDLSLSNLLEVASADPDGDGLTNAEEFLARTDPTDILSALRVLWADLGLEGVTLDWSSISGCVYDVEFSTNLEEGFECILEGIPANPPRNQVVVPASDGVSLFYRIRLVQ